MYVCACEYVCVCVFVTLLVNVEDAEPELEGDGAIAQASKKNTCVEVLR